LLNCLDYHILTLALLMKNRTTSRDTFLVRESLAYLVRRPASRVSTLVSEINLEATDISLINMVFIGSSPGRNKSSLPD
jgi:hypothetical protein